ncbi:MAG: hypothetical protein PF440_04880 [Thiomicrorhabdus sp.]|jgi:hypothetical protein|nr:hypothetical protein [Thiomicrorhabdus sp.]
MKLDETKCLASLAVFRELHDSKKDVYEIISEFLLEVITSNAKYQFNILEISNLLNSTFDFKIPEAVIKTSLKKLPFLRRDQGVYVVDDITAINKTQDISSKHSEIQRNNESIIDSLIDFIETQSKSVLTDDEKERIIHSFCNFLLDETISHQYNEYISAFIVNNQNNAGFTKQLETIKEGVVLYSGIKYNSNINEIGAWSTELTIFLDMEILFHFAGFNGEIYKQSFDDFHYFVKKINTTSKNKSGKKLIHLKYFKEVKYSIEGFFDKATFILKGQDSPDPSNTAMSSILDGCKSESGIITKKTQFFLLLNNTGILEDKFDSYFSPENHKYNIEDKEIIDDLSEKFPGKDISNNIKYLNFINIHRKEKCDNNFNNIGYMLLTGNSTTLNASWHKSIKPNGCVPLATSLDFLTNKFWFRLSRGFGFGDYPKSFGVITKAQILLSSVLNQSVGDKFKQLQNEFKNGRLTQQEALSTIVELRKRARKPEDINENDLSLILESISEDNIERYAKEHELFKAKASRQKDENLKLKAELLSKETEIINTKSILTDLQKKVQILEEKEEKSREKRKKIKRILTKTIYVLFLLCVVFLGVKLYRFDKKIIGSSLSLIASILAILAFLGIDYTSLSNLYRKIFKKKIT